MDQVNMRMGKNVLTVCTVAARLATVIRKFPCCGRYSNLVATRMSPLSFWQPLPLKKTKNSKVKPFLRAITTKLIVSGNWYLITCGTIYSTIKNNSKTNGQCIPPLAE